VAKGWTCGGALGARPAGLTGGCVEVDQLDAALHDLGAGGAEGVVDVREQFRMDLVLGVEHPDDVAPAAGQGGVEGRKAGAVQDLRGSPGVHHPPEREYGNNEQDQGKEAQRAGKCHKALLT
jgi:hypothetical protein